ncbi:MAG: hypothetical protein HKN28_00165 [Alphaproteobacteria bacterium]|nr:hypothetical protein [Alphaproteobacteria bacterium]
MAICISPVGVIRNSYQRIKTSAQFGVALLVLTFTLLTPGTSDALSFGGKSEIMREVDRLVEEALRGEDYHAALDSLVHYAETSDGQWGEQHYVFRKLEELAAPELKQYFLDVAQRKIEFKNSQQLSGIAHRVYWATLLTETNTEDQEIQLLLNGLKATVDFAKEDRLGLKSTVVRKWAADELCSRGNWAHFDAIVTSISSFKFGKDRQQLIELCRRKMEVLNGFGSRIDAMEHILVSSVPVEDEKITSWALNELFLIRSHEADELLFEYIVRSLEN